MPVRIIFRGLVLFKVTEGEKGSIVAKLVNPPTTHASPSREGGHMAEMEMSASYSHGAAPAPHSMLHQHQAEVQVYSRRMAANGDEQEEYEYKVLTDADKTIDLTFPGLDTDFVKRSQSYDEFCPKLALIMNDLTNPRAIGAPVKDPDAARMDSFVSHTVTVTRGTIRVREIVSWDAGGFPKLFDLASGVGVQLPVAVKFIGSNVHGHLASECVIDVADADSVKVDGKLVTLAKGTRHGGMKGDHSLRVPPKTVEMLFTNFPPQRDMALPWSGHFRYVLEAAGYLPVKLGGDDLDDFLVKAKRYNKTALDADQSLLVDAHGNGFPFPFIDPAQPSFELKPVNHIHAGNDPWNRPVCPMGDD